MTARRLLRPLLRHVSQVGSREVARWSLLSDAERDASPKDPPLARRLRTLCSFVYLRLVSEEACSLTTNLYASRVRSLRAGHRVRRHTHHGAALHWGLRLLPDVPRAQVRRPPRDLLLRPLLNGCTRGSSAASSSSRSLECRAHAQTYSMSQPCLCVLLCSREHSTLEATFAPPSPPLLVHCIVLIAQCSCHILMHYLCGGTNALHSTLYSARLSN